MLKRVLVTGIGGDIGHGIGKLLRKEGVTTRLVGCDVHSEHAGHLYFDAFETVARADSGDYVESLGRVVERHDIEVVIPTSEPELRLLVREGVTQVARAALVMPSADAMRLGFDKLETSAFLERHGLPFPWTTLVRDGSAPRFPCIVKSRYGAGSRDFAVVREQDASLVASTRPGDIWQELLEPAVEEYTCGVYRTRAREVRCIVFRRRLSGGITVYGKVVRDQPAIDALLTTLAERLDLVGSINAQLILTERGPVIFEINPRFSSTVVFRHLLGFQDVLWALQEVSGEAVSPYVSPPNGTAFYRSADEIIIPPAASV